MANIDVVPKRHTNVWVWVIALVILALVIGFFLFPRAFNQAPPVANLLSPTLTVTTVALA
jgi:hypothetical protein